MEIQEPIPAFVPAGVSGGDDLQRGCPTTTIFMVHSLMGPELDDHIGYREGRLAWPGADYKSLAYSPSVITGEDTFESGLEKEARNVLEQIRSSTEDNRGHLFTFCAHDIGGTIVKLVIIATREKKYQYIADRTHLVMFFGTPHRASQKHGFNSVILRIINMCSNILPGRWTPRMIDTLAIQHEDIERRFSRISYRFGIVNYYQSSTPASPYEVIVPEDCATMGHGTEVGIGRDHAHQYLPSFMSRAETMLLQRHILSTKIGHWDAFRKFIDLISTCDSQQNTSKIKPVMPVPLNAIFNSWILSEDLAPRFLALKPKGESDRIDILRMAAATIREHRQTPWVEYPEFYFPEEGELNIYASLILQVLAQQPWLFMNISQLVPMVMDSIRSTDQVWAGITLWRCLKALIHTPTYTPAYGFIHIGSPTSVHVLHMLDSALQATESNFRLVLAPSEDRYCHCEQFNPLVVDLEPSNRTLDAAEGRAPEKSTTIQARLLALTSRDPNLGHWVLCGLSWVAYAFRPLTLEELDVVLSLERHRLGISLHGFCAQFMQLLPGIIECKLGRIILVDSCPEAQEIVTEWLHVYGTSPDVLIAETSATFLETHVFKDKDGIPTQWEEWDISKLPIAYRGFTEYAARYYLLHYRRANMDDIRSQEAFSHFITDEKNLKNWVFVVHYFSQLTQSRIMDTDSIVETVGKYFETFQGLETLYNLATRPLQLNSFERLLIYAVEHADYPLLCFLHQNIELIDRNAVITAAAASRGAFYDELIGRVAPLLEADQTILSRIQLTAQTMGNYETASKIPSNLLDTMPRNVQNEWFADALRMAVECQDNEAVARLLDRRDLVQHIGNDRAPRWTVLHFAAYVGSLSIMSQLLHTGLQNIIDVLSPNGYSPLIIACSRGFLGIVRLLLSEGASVNLLGNSNKSALHFASQYGFLETAKELISKGSDITAADSEGNSPLHIAIRNRKTKLAVFLVGVFPSIIVDAGHASGARSPVSGMDIDYADVTEPRNEISHQSHNTDIEMADDNESGSGEIDETHITPLDYVNEMGRTVLSEAAEQNLPSVVKCLLEKGVDPNVSDDLSYTAIHLAAKMDALEVIQILLTQAPALDIQDKDNGCTPLHFCCYRGHLETALQLLKSGAEIGLRDRWNRTPLSAACTSGSLPLVQALLPRYGREEWAESLAQAAIYGYYDVAMYLLDMDRLANVMTAGTTALLGASQFAQPRIVELLLLRGADVDVAGSQGQRAIHGAVRAGSSEVIDLLSDRGAELDVEDVHGDTPLSVAIHLGCPETVALLLKKGAAIKLPRRWRYFGTLLEFSFHHFVKKVVTVLLDFYKQRKLDLGLTPLRGLLIAIKGGNEDLVNFVLDWYGPDKTEDISIGEALHYAIQEEKIIFLRKLLDHPVGKAAINYEVQKKGTLLHAAAHESTREVVRILLKKGADASIVAGRFGTALNAACAAGKSNIARTLIRRMPTYDRNASRGVYGTPMQSAIVGFQHKSGNDTIVFLEYLNRKTSSLMEGGAYSTPLHASLNLWLPVPSEVVSWLIKNANELLHQGLSGLHYSAISRSPVPMANVLQLEWKGDSINEKDNDGWTPLHWACRQPSADILKVLIEKGADLTARTNEGWTPRQIAIVHGNTDDEYLRMLPDVEKGEGMPGIPAGKFNAECKVCGCFGNNTTAKTMIATTSTYVLSASVM
ncbi:hypothetical protein O1611_g4676 [Lasiodiplodia mahajangana]|uniref:Uncharacterized protein n=1 Tax=Lasiodiplodia mahajangana TaxID=1108764 RepID=A0ACC2JNN7_9PEZI|nr:hypothetical protein O1611_g4676 [Lasiodiplodia mahajangana]